MGVNTLDAKVKVLKLIGGKIAPKSAELFEHLIKQSQMQAIEGKLIAEDFTKLQARVNGLEKKQTLSYKEFRNLLLIFWAGVLLAVGLVMYG